MKMMRYQYIYNLICNYISFLLLKGFFHTNSNAIINSKKLGVKPLLKNIVKL